VNYTRSEFAQKIKAKYPSYASVDDETLVTKILTKYPEYGKGIIEEKPSLLERAKEGIGAGVEAAKGLYESITAKEEPEEPPVEQRALPLSTGVSREFETPEEKISFGVTREFGEPEGISKQPAAKQPPTEIPLIQLSLDPKVAAMESRFITIDDPRARALELKSIPQERGIELMKQLPWVEQAHVRKEMEVLLKEDREANALAFGILQSTPIPTFFPKETKEELEKVRQAAPIRFAAGQITGTIAQAIVGGRLVGAALNKIAPIAKSPLLKTALSRVLTTGAISAEQNIGRKDLGEAMKDVAQQSGGGLISVIPEVLAPPGVAQLIAQPLTDLVYDVAAGKIRGEDVGSKEWWKNEVVSLASAAGFAIRDVAAGKTFKLEQAAQRDELKKLIGQGKIKDIQIEMPKERSDKLNQLIKESLEKARTPSRKPVIEPQKPEFEKTEFRKDIAKEVFEGEVLPSEMVETRHVRAPATEEDIETTVDITGKEGYIKEYEQPSEPQPQPVGTARAPAAGELRPEAIPPYTKPEPTGAPAGEGAVGRGAPVEQKYSDTFQELKSTLSKPSPFSKAITDEIDRLDRPEQFETAMVPEGIGERGSVNLSVAKDARNELGKIMQQQLTTRGGLPKEVFRRKMQKEHWINAELKEIEHTVNEFKSKATKAYGKSRLSSQEAFELDAALKGEKPIEELKPELQPVVKNMRNHIDALSQKLIDEGVIAGDLEGKVSENMGFYTHRSYRVFDDPDWAKKVPEPVRNRAKAFIRDEHPDLSEAEVNGRIDELLYKEDAPIAMLAKGKLGSKKLDVLKHRKEIPAEIRSLWGEYKDADVNYAKSVSKMASLIANHKFLNDVKAEGLGKYFHEKPIVQQGKSYSVPISGEVTPSMKPLSGLYTTKEIKEAFEKTMSSTVDPAWLRGLIGVSSTAKYAKTILSPMTHLRNVTGNTGFAIMNGHVDVTKAPKAIASTFKDFANKGTAEQKRYLRELTELGVIGTGARYGEIKDIVKDVTQGDIDMMIGTGKRRAAKKVIKGIEKLYGAEDDVWKVFAYENELKRYKKAMPGASEQEIKEHVANIVRNTYPTYEMIPELVRSLRKFPFVGSFVSFPAEVIRTAANTTKLAMTELKTPGLQAIGAKRLAGILTAATITGAATAGARYLTGTNRKKDEAYRTFMGPWSQNSQIIYTGKGKEGEQNYIDLGYTDPHSYMKNVVIAAMRGEDVDQKAIQSLSEAFSPFLSEDLMTQKLLDISRNKKKDGTQVWNTEDALEGKMTKAAAHFADAITPGAIAGAKRMYQATKEGAGKYGQKYDLKTEAIAQSTGVRVSRLNVARSLKYKSFQLRRDLTEAARLKYKGERISEREKIRENKIVSKLRKRFLLTGDLKSVTNTLKSHGISEGRVFSEIQRQKILNKYVDTLKDAMVAGLSSNQIFNILKDSGVPKKDAAIMVYQRMVSEGTKEESE